MQAVREAYQFGQKGMRASLNRGSGLTGKLDKKAASAAYNAGKVAGDRLTRQVETLVQQQNNLGGGRQQNVHSEQWISLAESDKIKIEKTIGLSDETERYYLPDIEIGRSLGAKGKNYPIRLPDGSDTQLTEGSRVTNVQQIAGPGRKREVDKADILCMSYPGSAPEDWKKFKGIGYVDYEGESYKAELHWFEEKTVGRVEWKVKPDADGNWFIED